MYSVKCCGQHGGSHGKAQETCGNVALVPEKADTSEARCPCKTADDCEAAYWFKKADSCETPDKRQTSSGREAAGDSWAFECPQATLCQ